YFLIFNSGDDSSEGTQTSTTTTTTSSSATTTTTSQDVMPASIDKTLQEAITASCVKVSYGGTGYGYYIKENNFPFTIDASKMTVLDDSLEKAYQGVCVVVEENPGTADITFSYKLDGNTENRAYVFDEDTVELGHGGPPFFGDFGELVSKGDDYRITTYIVLPDVSANTPGEYSLYLRVKKILGYKDGYKIYLNTWFLVDDENLEAYLTEHSDMVNGMPSVDYEEATAGLVDEFFNKHVDLMEAEQEAYDKAMEFVNAIDYK
ncbi:hypothetical protein KJ918_00410, partial [Patescibacteria group bacterium]|nr:hypothetical protein [Patescibacteria group bacterium]